MALVPSFTAVGTSDPTAIFLTDTSTGSDVAITDRQILIYKVDNTLLTPAIDWPLANTTITINPLTSDVAVNILVQWNDVSAAVLYQASNIEVFTEYGEQFLYNLTQNLSSQPDLINDQNFRSDYGWFDTLINAANRAIIKGLDIYTAQNCVDIYTSMMQNQSLFF